MLKIVHPFHERSTWEIFEKLTEMTKRCEFEIDTYEITDPYYKESTYYGQSIDGKPYGVGRIVG